MSNKIDTQEKTKLGKENKRWARRAAHFLAKVAGFLSTEAKWNKLWARRKAKWDKRLNKKK